MISDPFKSVWRDYRNQKGIEARKSYLKQLAASAYQLTLFTGDIKQRGTVIAIGNRIRKSEYCDIDRKTVYKLWAIANQPKPEIMKSGLTPKEVANGRKRPRAKEPQKLEVEVRRKRKLIR